MNFAHIGQLTGELSFVFEKVLEESFGFSQTSYIFYIVCLTISGLLTGFSSSHRDYSCRETASYE